MVFSAVQLIRAQGVAATGVREVVDHSRAPRGSFQHYFPGGKDQLVGEALLRSGEFAARWAAEYRNARGQRSPAGLFAHMARWWKEELGSHDYQHGCPVMAAAGDLAGTGSAVNAVLGEAVDRWASAVVGELVALGVPRRRATRLATLMLSALEGAIMLARVRRDLEPLDTVVAELRPLLNGQLNGQLRSARR